MSVREAGLFACAFCEIIAIGRIIFLIGWRQPVLARVLSIDYPEREQEYDADFRRIHLVDQKITSADLVFRNIVTRVRYEWDGKEYAQDVPVFTHRGYLPDRQEILWIDPRNPSKVTSRGIGVAATCMLGIGLFAILLWQLAL